MKRGGTLEALKHRYWWHYSCQFGFVGRLGLSCLGQQRTLVDDGLGNACHVVAVAVD